jgi:hypothetical protein
MDGRPSWQSLAHWTFALALLTFAVLGALSIGVFVLPFAVAAIVFAARRKRSWPEPYLGGVLGVATVCLYVAYRARNYTPCTPSGTAVRLGPGERLTCGGLDPLPWLIVGGTLLTVGVIGYFLLRRRNEIVL